MSATIHIPSAEDLILKGIENPQPAQKTLAHLLTRKFYGSSAPLLLMTRGEVKNLPHVAGWSLDQIECGLADRDLRLRSNDETLAERVVSLFGSIEAMPLSALSLKIEDKRGIDVVMGTQTSVSLRWILEVNERAKLGDFMDTGEQPYPRISVRDRVREFIMDYHAPLRLTQEPDCTNTANELTKLMVYWVNKR